MPNYLAISPKECHGLAWFPPQDVQFAAHNPLVSLHAGELAKAASAMPLALVKEGREWKLVGVAGLNPSHNLFIREGKWLGQYRPQSLSTWPFSVVSIGEKGVVTFDRDSGLLSESVEAQGAEPFFDQEGNPQPSLQSVLDILKSHHGKHRATQKALAALNSAKLIVPWPEQFLASMGMRIKGLHMIDETALAQLDDQAFLELRGAQALPLAYALNLSLQQAHLLARLDRLNPAQTAVPDNLEDVFGNDDDEFTFDFDS